MQKCRDRVLYYDSGDYEQERGRGRVTIHPRSTINLDFLAQFDFLRCYSLFSPKGYFILIFVRYVSPCQHYFCLVLSRMMDRLYQFFLCQGATLRTDTLLLVAMALRDYER
jgi:hypothetical protein